MLGKPREQHVPPLVAGQPRRVRQQPPALPGRLLVVLLQELHDQPPAHIEVRLGRDECRELSNGHRLVVADTQHLPSSVRWHQVARSRYAT
jgi:hypothetical protein